MPVLPFLMLQRSDILFKQVTTPYYRNIPNIPECTKIYIFAIKINFHIARIDKIRTNYISAVSSLGLVVGINGS